ncbi:protein KRI1 homolog [Elysia marginata]|uniref:Protein KRI1 homolog n=1 Tax=Elysia marginata TaxID=1093978 RepID=A0AAV4EW18_9GAST|nr:protein KRI1 homolog [Elysia marginata]
MDLFDSDSNDEEVSFKINEGYAKNYEKWRKKEEKQKLLDRYGKQETSDSSSEEEEIRSTPQMDKDWLRAYAVVRFQQPRLYKEDTAKPISKKKEKAITLKDHERKFILEKGGIASDEESKKPQTSVGKSYYEEQEEIKKNLKDAIGDSSDSESNEEEDLLVKAHKTEEQKQQEENEYLEWLKGERESLGDPDAEAELAPLKQYWNDPSISEKEKVLRDYILNNGYMDQEESDSDSDDDTAKLHEGPDHDEEENFLKEADKYEYKYNFRHEEPGGDEIKSYPRIIETSVRTKDTRRAEKRKEKLERKRKEKEKIKDEIRLLQKLQMEEKMEKLETLRKIAHRPDLDYDLDADFDPDKHNEIMKKYFDDDYYEEDDADQKPTFDYDAAIDEEEGKHCSNGL